MTRTGQDGASPRQAADALVVGLDVGSTTVKAVVLDAATRQILWSDYQRHETRQAEKTLELLVAMGRAFADVPRERDPDVHHRIGFRTAARAPGAQSSFRRSTP